jgi:hypothetical protein
MNKDAPFLPIYTFLKTAYLTNPDNYKTQKPYIKTKSTYHHLSTHLQKISYYQKLLYVGRPCFLLPLLHFLENADTDTKIVHMRNPFLQVLLLDLLQKSRAGQKVSLALLRWFRAEGWEFPFQEIECYNLQEDYPVDYTYQDRPIESPSYGDLPPKPEVVEQPKYVRLYSAEEIDYWRKKIDQFRYGSSYIW